MGTYEHSAVGTSPSGEMETNEISDLKLEILASAKCDGFKNFSACRSAYKG